jgi:hypothetical protein
MNTRDDLSDADVLTAARDSLSRIPISGPPDVAAIMASGSARRRRRLIPAATGTLAGVAGAAIAVTALVPGGHQPGHPAARQPTIRLTAWTVDRLADGNISVTIRELKDPAGLQSTLRADGVPVSVTFASQPDRACRAYPGGTPGPPPHPGTALLRRVFPEPYRRLDALPSPPRSGGMSPVRLARQVHARPLIPRPSPNQTVIVIDPSALPGKAGVQLGTSPGGNAVLIPAVVYASAQCTGNVNS